MTILHLFKRYPQPSARPTRSRWNKPEPFRPGVGVALLGLGVLLGLGYLLESFFAERGDAALLLIFATALLLVGSVRLLFGLGAWMVHRLRGMPRRCGCCRFFEVPGGLYVIGRCQADPDRRMVSRVDGCRAFCFSERALARDRLGQHPGVLKQLQITRAGDAARQS